MLSQHAPIGKFVPHVERSSPVCLTNVSEIQIACAVDRVGHDADTAALIDVGDEPDGGLIRVGHVLLGMLIWTALLALIFRVGTWLA